VTVNQFKYLSHIIDNSFSDDSNINTEIKLFTRTNLLGKCFKQCSLIRTFCMCFYDIALWTHFTIGAFNRFTSCYYKCITVIVSLVTQGIAVLQMCCLSLNFLVLILWFIIPK